MARLRILQASPGSGPVDYLGLALVCVLAALALRRTWQAAGVPLMVMVVLTALVGVYFRARTGGQLFFFKDLAFLGPYVLMLALYELGMLFMSPGRGATAVGAVGLIAAIVTVSWSAARELDETYVQATQPILALHSWDQALPRGSSVRTDVPPSGIQLWTTYMFNDHPLCALDPLAGFFPHPVQGRKADYVIAGSTQPRPADASGSPIFKNAQFALWKMKPTVPGPAICSRRFVDISGVTTGF